MIKISNAKIITPHRIIDNGSILIKDGIIAEVSQGLIYVEGAIETDAKGQYVSPGFIDIHVHGGGGHDFMDCSVPAYLEIAATHAAHGTTAMFPTTLTSTREDIVDIIEVFEKAQQIN